MTQLKQVTITFYPAKSNAFDVLGQRGLLRIAEFRDDNVVDVWEGYTTARNVKELLGEMDLTLSRSINFNQPDNAA